MKIGFHSTALDGQTVTLTANGIGPVTQTNWGQPASGGSGSAKIVIERSNLKVAPDPVRFRVDLTGSGFDTPKGAANRYDPQAHETILLWDLGDASDFVAPEKILPEWRAKRNAKGPFVAHCYATPGTYDVSVLAVEPSSGKTLTLSAQLVVGNADTVYTGNKTICINPVGDSDFTGAPTGAVQVNSNSFTSDLAEWKAANTENRGVCRYLLKRGGTYDVAVDLAGGVEPNLYFGAYGTGADPITNIPVGGSAIKFVNQYQGLSSDTVTDFRVVDWAFRGNFDPTTDPHTSSTDKTGAAFSSTKYGDVVFHGCHFSGSYSSTIIHQPNRRDIRQHFMLSDCSMTNVGGQYPIFYGKVDHAEASVTHIGCRLGQNPDALSYSGGVIRAITRIERYANIHIRSCDYFQVDRLQPCIKLNETPEEMDGAYINVHSNSFEGGLRPVGLALNSPVGGRATVQNMVLDGNIIVGDFSSSLLLDMCATGSTIRNNLMIMPNTLYLQNDMKRIVSLKIDHGTVPQYVLDSPVHFYNNTIVNQRVPANNGGYSIAVGNDVFLGRATIANSVSEGLLEQSGVLNGFEPYDGAVLWVPRSKGYKDPNTGVMNTDHATPSNSVKGYKPLTGSPAIGAAKSGKLAKFDIAFKTRSDPATSGAWG